jgi:hypothetical protein
MSERVELEDGQWIDFTTEPNHGQAKRVNRAGLSADTDAVGFLDEIGKALAVDWNIKDIPFVAEPGPDQDAAWDRLDARAADKAQGRAVEVWAEWREATDPKDGAARSPS